MEILKTNLENVARVHKGNAEYGAYGPGDVPVYGPDGVVTHVAGAQGYGPAIIVPGKNDGGSQLFFVGEAGPFYCTDTVYYLTVKHKEMEAKFLYYWLVSLHLEKGPEITEASLYNLNPPIPPKDTQKEMIAKIDAEPALCDQVIATLGSPGSWVANWLLEEPR